MEDEFPYYSKNSKLNKSDDEIRENKNGSNGMNKFHGRVDGPFQVSIGSLDDPSKTVYAQYRPKELQVDQTVPWTKHTNKSPDGSLQLEFSGAEGQVTSLELFFDASEEPGESVKPVLDDLTLLARVRDPSSREDAMKRPHRCVLVFGNVYSKHFECVIESVSIKYTMFSPGGDPIRATANLKLRETHLVDMTDGQKKGKAKAKTS